MIFQKGMGFGFLLLLEWALGLGLVCAGEVRCVEREREALLRFKKGLVDDSGFLSSWGSEECCEWKGVVCSNTTAHVIAILLGFMPMGGKISDALLELHRLTNLDLSNNNFDQLPEFIGSIKQLEHLNLRACSFSGIVPPQLGNLTNLQTLDLSYNNFFMSNDINWLSHLTLLTRLDLSYLDLSHTNWLQPILKLRSLQELILQYSSITSVAPSANFSSVSLSTLDLGSNRLTSSSLDWLFNISSNLAKIVMSENELDGPIPKVFGRFSSLTYLDLSGNMLEGEISKSLGNLSHLQTLDLSYNQLIGSLALLDLKAFPALRYLDLGRNKLTGSMPESLSKHSVLEVLDVSLNSLEGIISEANFSKLHNLMVLHLSFNSLTLQISQDWIPPFQLSVIRLAGCNMRPHFPKWLHTQKKVYTLDLSYAGITDEVPNWLWSFSPLLLTLNLSYNQISGVIPDLSSSSITYIDVSYNKFSGPIPLFQQNTSIAQFSQNMFFGSFSSICMIMHVSFLFLDLSNNQLTGEIPNCWEKMSDLYLLNLADNNFFGEIPHTLGSLSYLWSLNLSGNNLSGVLPLNLVNCGEMMFIDVGGNKLNGNIPPWIGANVNLMYVIFSHNNFYGSIPPEICNLTYVQVLDLSRNHISGEIPQCFHKFTSMVEENSSTPVDYITQWTALYEPLKQFEYAFVQWKGGEFEYRRNLKHLKLIDLSRNRLMGSIPISFSKMKGLVSLNLSRNLLTGAIIPNIGQMGMLEVLDLSINQLSGDIPISLAQLHFLAVLDLANNKFSGRIPTSTQLQSFNESSYAGNDNLCGLPLKMCSEDVPSPSNTDEGESIKNDGGIIMRLSFMQEIGISMALGFIVGFWGVVGSMVVKRSWRVAYFKLLDEADDWFYIATFKLFRRSRQI